MEEYLISFVKNIVETNIFVSYLFFFISSLLQVTFPPYPGDTITVFSGYVTTVSNSFGLTSVGINSISGTILGSYIIYKIGYLKGESVLNYKMVKMFFPEKKKKRAQELFDKYGAGAIFLSKFVPGVNTIIVLFAGIFKIKPYVAFVSFVSAAVIHNIILVFLGAFLGNNMEYIKLLISTYNMVVLIIIGILVLGAYLYFCFNKRNNKE